MWKIMVGTPSASLNKACLRCARMTSNPDYCSKCLSKAFKVVNDQTWIIRILSSDVAKRHKDYWRGE